MQAKRIVLPIIGFALVIFVIFALLEIAKHPATERLRRGFKDKSAVLFDSLSEDISQPVRRPLTTIELEANLKVNLPVPFKKFNEEDWEWFWDLLYGEYPVDSSGWPKKMRQLSKQEIQDILVDYYAQPFGFFQQKQWGIFWQYILKGKVFEE